MKEQEIHMVWILWDVDEEKGVEGSSRDSVVVAEEVAVGNDMVAVTDKTVSAIQQLLLYLNVARFVLFYAVWRNGGA